MIDGLECRFLVEAILTKYSRDKPELRRILKAAEQDFIPSKHDPKIAIAFWKNLSAELAHMCEDADILESEIDRLLANNLVFDRTNDGPGEDCYEHCFLCTKIADDEMPWDATTLEW